MISVIVPVLNEQARLAAALGALAEQAGAHEVIVADGGSSDESCAIAGRLGARVVRSGRGRGRQMNAGAAEARGEVLLFLHVDTELPPGALLAVAAASTRPGVAGGGFRKRYQDGGWLLLLTGALLNALRSGWRRHLVGTQGMFVPRAMFERLGGFPDWPLLEDVGLSDRLRRAGRVELLPLAVTVSARRYRRRGVLRQVLVNALVLVLFRAGVAPRRLERLYRGLP